MNAAQPSAGDIHQLYSKVQRLWESDGTSDIECELRMPILANPDIVDSGVEYTVSYSSIQGVDIRRTSESTVWQGKETVGRLRIASDIVCVVSLEYPISRSQSNLLTISYVRRLRRRVEEHTHYTAFFTLDIDRRTMNLEIELRPGMTSVEVDEAVAYMQRWRSPYIPFQKPLSVYPSDIWHALRTMSASGGITYKLDGLRVHLIMRCCSDTSDYALIDDVRIIDGHIDDGMKLVLDGELMQDNTIHIFDILSHPDMEFSDISPHARMLRYSELVVSGCLEPIPSRVGHYDVVLKKYWLFDSFDDFCSLYMSINTLTPKGLLVDGVIICIENECYKSKPITTVDVEIVDGKLLLGNGVCLANTTLKYPDHTIIEVTESGSFVRIRDDKIKPNMKLPVFSDSAYLLATGIGCYGLRAYHNMVKDWVLRGIKYKGMTLLDVGSGAGGDVNKWSSIGISNVICVDPSLNIRSNANTSSMNISFEFKSIQTWIAHNPGVMAKYAVSMFFVPDPEALYKIAMEQPSVICVSLMLYPKPIDVPDIVSVSVTQSNVNLIIKESRTATNINEPRVCDTLIKRVVDLGYSFNIVEHPDRENAIKSMSVHERMLASMYAFIIFNRTAKKV